MRSIVLALTVANLCAGSHSAIAQYRVEEIRIRSSDHVLAGSLYLPDSCRLCPGTVFLGGGSAKTRANQIPFAERFAAAGVISLIYDKRGEGESTGSSDERSFDDLANDALAAVRLLQGRDEVDGDGVGIWGGSEGGTIALMAAARDTSLAFVVNLAGPVDGFREGFLFDINQSMVARGIDDDDRTAVLNIWDRYFDDASDGLIEDHVLAEVGNWRDRGLEMFVPPDTVGYPPDPVPDPRSFWHLHRLRVLDRLTMPVLFLYGELDEWVSAESNAMVIESVLGHKQGADYRIHVFPQASHGFTTPEGYLVKDFFETQVEWILEQRF